MYFSFIRAQQIILYIYNSRILIEQVKILHEKNRNKNQLHEPADISNHICIWLRHVGKIIHCDLFEENQVLASPVQMQKKKKS